MENNLKKQDSRVFMLINFMSEELNSIQIKIKNLKEWLKENPSVSLLKRIDKKSGSEYFVLQENYSKKPKQRILKNNDIESYQKRIEKFKEKRSRVREEIRRLNELQKGLKKMLNYSNRVFNIEE